jgi:signal peptide peptidase SppA
MAYSPDAFEMLFHGLTDSRDVLEMVERARTDPGIRGAMLDINSPGGMVTGGVEVAERVGEMRRAKPVVAHIGGLGASLAYWIASQANAVTISPGASAGSIGAMVPVTDISRALENAGIKVEAIVSEGARYKAGGMPGTSLSESAREQLQERVNAVGKQFRNAVTRTRPGIPEDAMRGQIFGATQAKQLGFADAIGDSRYAMALLRGMAPAGN